MRLISSLLSLFFISCGFHLVLAEPQVGEITLCDDSGCKLQSVSPLSKRIRVRIQMKRAPYGTRIATRWYYRDGQRAISLRDRVTDLDAPRAVEHDIKLPRPGWFKAGNYVVHIDVNGKRVRSLSFIVPKRPEPKPPAAKSTPPVPKKPEKDILDDDF